MEQLGYPAQQVPPGYPPQQVVPGYPSQQVPPGYAPPAGYQLTPVQEPKKKRRIFVWFFLAVQLLFIVWIIGGVSSVSGNPTDCGILDAKTCNDAQNVGTTIGVATVMVFWVIVDFLLAFIYGAYRLATRP